MSQGKKTSESQQTLEELADWIVMNWMQMSEQVRSSRAVFDLCQQNSVSGAGVDDQGSSTDGQLIALHAVTQNSSQGKHSQDLSRQSTATLLMFRTVGCSLTPCSKIQFYSDPHQVDLVSEISAGTEVRKALPPLLLNHGQIWAKVKPGSLALLGCEQQHEAVSCLPCAVF